MFLSLGCSALILWIQCTPIARNWDFTVKGTCWDPKFYVIEGVVSGGLLELASCLTSKLTWTSIWRLYGYSPFPITMESDLEITNEEDREDRNSARDVHGCLVSPTR